jgi:hypothetical protein
MFQNPTPDFKNVIGPTVNDGLTEAIVSRWQYV